MNKTISATLAFVVIVAASIAVGGFAIQKLNSDNDVVANPVELNIPERTAEDDIQPIDTSGWVEHRNEKIGFLFKYPPDWVPFERDNGSWWNRYLQFSYIPHEDTNKVLVGDIRGSVDVVDLARAPSSDENVAGQRTVDEWFAEVRVKENGTDQGPEFAITTRNATLEWMTIDGRRAYLEGLESIPESEEIGAPSTYRTLTIDGGSNRILILQFHSPIPTDEQTLNVINAVFETFEFIEPSGVSCRRLNTLQTRESGEDANWKGKVEANRGIAELISSYDTNTTYGTYMGNICELANGDSLLTFSHYATTPIPDGTMVASTFAKGLAQFDAQENEVFVNTTLPCEENLAPDASAPATIVSVVGEIVTFDCPGFAGAEGLTFDLATFEFID